LQVLKQRDNRSGQQGTFVMQMGKCDSESLLGGKGLRELGKRVKVIRCRDFSNGESIGGNKKKVGWGGGGGWGVVGGFWCGDSGFWWG